MNDPETLKMFRQRKRRPVLLVIIALIVVAGGWIAWTWAHVAPKERLEAGAEYPDMPADAHHHYIDLPLDHADPAGPRYRGFYILSANFDAHGPVVFLLTDGQMELVHPGIDMAFFDMQLSGVAYVLIGHRGHKPAQFPEVYPGGSLDIAAAMKFYGSWQQVEDIEAVRQEMVRKQLLPEDGRIMLFGASGAGVLAQQYIARHGEHVSRAMLVTTGAPDLSRRLSRTYARPLRELDQDAAAHLSHAGPDPARAWLAFQLSRSGAAGLDTLRSVAAADAGGNPLPRIWQSLHPSRNWTIARLAMTMPAADAAKVRMYELMGSDLRARVGDDDVPLYRWSATVLGSFLSGKVLPPGLELDRSRYAGEVLVVSAEGDAVFSPTVGQAIASSYPNAAYLLVRGGHRLELDRPYHNALRATFFRRGLQAPEVRQLLAQAPRS